MAMDPNIGPRMNQAEFQNYEEFENGLDNYAKSPDDLELRAKIQKFITEKFKTSDFVKTDNKLSAMEIKALLETPKMSWVDRILTFFGEKPVSKDPQQNIPNKLKEVRQEILKVKLKADHRIVLNPVETKPKKVLEGNPPQAGIENLPKLLSKVKSHAQLDSQPKVEEEPPSIARGADQTNTMAPKSTILERGVDLTFQQLEELRKLGLALGETESVTPPVSEETQPQNILFLKAIDDLTKSNLAKPNTKIADKIKLMRELLQKNGKEDSKFRNDINAFAESESFTALQGLNERIKIFKNDCDKFSERINKYPPPYPLGIKKSWNELRNRQNELIKDNKALIEDIRNQFQMNPKKSELYEIFSSLDNILQEEIEDIGFELAKIDSADFSK